MYLHMKTMVSKGGFYLNHRMTQPHKLDFVGVIFGWLVPNFAFKKVVLPCI